MSRIRKPGNVLLAVLAATTTLAVTTAFGPAATADGSAAPIVHTDSGDVQGVSRGGVDNFLGMRYAQAPVGPLRWRPPQPARPWTGVVQATQYGNRCPALPSTNGPLSLTEDCLFLNVQRPTGTGAGAGLPVYVFIHGGGNATGSSNQHDGTSIVQQTGVIVVTMNYRLGVFGWFAHPALTAEQGESGNYGFQDIEASLAWVQQNIAAFGGDPGRVTIGGESSGAFSVCALLAAPAVRGMFSAAIMQSGGCTSDTQADAEGYGEWLAGQVGCTDPATALSCLRGLDTQTLLTAAGNNAGPYVSGTPTLPADPWTAVQQGQIAHVPLILGANRDEGRTFTRDNIGMTAAGYTQWLRGAFGNWAGRVNAHYPWPAHADQFTGAYLTGAILTDGGLFGWGGCATRDLAGAFAGSTDVWVYQFDHRTGPGLSPDPAGYVWGAGHAAELAYLWPSFDNGTPIAPTFNAGERQLAHDMTAYWGSFVTHRRPAVAQLAAWPEYNVQHDQLSLRAGGASAVIDDSTVSSEHQCGFWG
jgi:para-nitrobenzyl esterase